MSDEMKTDEAPENAAPASVDALQDELHKIKQDYLYLRAEFDNYRRQATKERSDLLKFGGERLAKDLLETLDIFDSALEKPVTAETLKSFVSGIELTAQQLRSTLAKHNIHETPALHTPFDPSIHEALGSEPSKEVPPGYITRVFKKAYKFYDKVLRPAQVIVAKENEKSENSNT